MISKAIVKHRPYKITIKCNATKNKLSENKSYRKNVLVLMRKQKYGSTTKVSRFVQKRLVNGTVVFFVLK